MLQATRQPYQGTSISIQQIVQPQTHIQLGNDSSLDKLQINNLFKSFELPQFDLSVFATELKQTHYAKCILKQLTLWNQQVASKQKSTNCRSQLFRNKFLYQELKNIQKMKPQQRTIYLRKLACWLEKNSKNFPQSQFHHIKSNPNEEMDVRKYFATNTVDQIKEYRRKQLCATLQISSSQRKILLQNKQNSNEVNKSSDHCQEHSKNNLKMTSIKEGFYKRESQRLRLQRELTQINQFKKMAKKKLSQRKQHNINEFLQRTCKLSTDIYREQMTKTAFGKFSKLRALCGKNQKGQKSKNLLINFGSKNNADFNQFQRKINSTQICRSLNVSRLRCGQQLQLNQSLQSINGFHLLSLPVQTPTLTTRKKIRK